ncbi:MAG: hypothetical protein GX154_05005 [Clostridiales bacterium]|nr:hypothetical protein [Clostridiales bacterium]
MSNFDKNRTGTGTKEWSEHSYNIQKGCKNNCLYCYARANALRFKLIASTDEWKNEVIRENAVKKTWGKKDGVIMFPTTHDITLNNIKHVIETLTRMLIAGNHVLIVSKPCLSCIEQICTELSDFRSQIMFRFTIGSLNRADCLFWEPNAPEPRERLLALIFAYEHGYKTSVSMEPILGDYDEALRTFYAVEQYVTDTVWIGKMNKVRRRVDLTIPGALDWVAQIECTQDDWNILMLVDRLEVEPKVRWKDSVKQVIEKCRK